MGSSKAFDPMTVPPMSPNLPLLRRCRSGMPMARPNPSAVYRRIDSAPSIASCALVRTRAPVPATAKHTRAASPAATRCACPRVFRSRARSNPSACAGNGEPNPSRIARCRPPRRHERTPPAARSNPTDLLMPRDHTITFLPHDTFEPDSVRQKEPERRSDAARPHEHMPVLRHVRIRAPHPVQGAAASPSAWPRVRRRWRSRINASPAGVPSCQVPNQWSSGISAEP